MKMLKAVKSAPSITSPISFPARSAIGGVGSTTTAVRFTQSQPENNFGRDMDGKDKKNNMTKNPNEKTGYRDVMSDSFGEGYASRSDDEGFGGTYGGNRSTAPGDDGQQGSQVKDTEKARNHKEEETKS